MVRRLSFIGGVLVALFCFAASVSAQQPGSIRGMVHDADFEAPLGGVRVSIEGKPSLKATGTEQGNYSFGEVPPGIYTVVFSKEGYTRLPKMNVVVQPGQITEVDASMTGDFEVMDELVVVDINIGGSGEIEKKTLETRLEAPEMKNIVHSQDLSKWGLSDAAKALTAVPGVTVSEGKYAVVRGLPDRYVSSQMNGVRLPTADAKKRAVQLDQFPAAVIDSIDVSKTFTPDQQGDASGGAVNVILKGIPEKTGFTFDFGVKSNSRVKGDFLTYKGGGLGFLGKDAQNSPLDRLSGGALGTSFDDAPSLYKWSFAGGGSRSFDNAITFGAFLSVFYEKDASFYDDGIDDSYWVLKPGDPMTPQFSQGAPEPWDPKDPYNPAQAGTFMTSLFDVTQGKEEVKWGALGVLGAKTKHHSLTLTYMFTRVATDVATLAENTRGKLYYFPGYDADNSSHPGNLSPQSSPYLRLETLEYTERTTQTVQLTGKHTLPIPEIGGKFLKTLPPELDWVLAKSSSEMYQPDKRLFGEQWWAPLYYPGFPPWVDPFFTDPNHRQFKPAANFTLGNVQRIWKDISEESDQYSINLKFPFEQWTKTKGYLKFGVFDDKVLRLYDQDSYSNFRKAGSPEPSYVGPWETHWSSVFPGDDGAAVTAADIDVDYTGHQRIKAWYWMADLPVCSKLRFIGGVRHETTDLRIITDPDNDVTWIPPGDSVPTKIRAEDVDVSFHQEDTLPSIGLVYTPWKPLTLRASYAETVARQTFRELTPIMQMDYLGGEVFIGNPHLQMSALKNYDLRADYAPFAGGLFSVSWFKKDITDPIEYAQYNAGFTYTSPVNYPEGTLKGWELEARQDLGRVWKPLKGLSLGANATLIDSQVTLPEEEAAAFDEPNIKAPMKTRDMTNAPAHLYNFFVNYDIERLGTQLSVFYTVRGDTLVAGAGQSNGKFVPSVYEKEYGTLNAGVTQKIGKHVKLKFQAKNLTNPAIQQIYRSPHIGDDVVKTSYKKGIELSAGIFAEFKF